MKKMYLLPLLLLLLVAGCEKDDDTDSSFTSDNEPEVNAFVYQVMQQWYLWNDSLPTFSSLSNFSTPQALVDTMVVQVDNWSFIAKEEDVNSSFNEGEDFGFGFYLGWDEENPDNSSTLRVMFVYNNTSAYEAGIRRGWTLLEIDGTSVYNISDFTSFFSTDPGSMEFKFKNNLGNEVDITLTKETYYMNGIMAKTIFEFNGESVGYMAYHSFLSYATSDLEDAISYFSSSGIDELIVDLRFNTGGNVSVAYDLSNILVTSSAVGSKYIDMIHNDDRQADYDTTYYFKNNSSNLGLDRVFFITNEYTASASELVINGLTPHMDVVTIGETTYGKPVAMYGFKYEEWLFYPVAAKSINANGYGDYFDGLTPDYYVYDQFHYDWADEDEPAIAQALEIIQTGTSTSQKAVGLKTHRQKVIDSKRLHRGFLIKD